MNTHTPGAASELQAHALLRDLEKLRRCLGFGAITFGSEIIERLRKFVEAHNAPPVPVTEGAQREAVAWRIRYKGASYWSLVPDLSDLSEPLSSFETEPLYTAPPPPDRVQPERVEADSFTHKRNAICERELGIPFEDPAPPNDASGGVTEKVMNLVRDIALCDCAFCMRKKAEIQGALEAADRARKPGYREVTLDDIDVLNLAVDKWMTTEVGFTCDDKDFSLKEAHFRRRMFAALQHIGAVIPDARK